MDQTVMIYIVLITMSGALHVILAIIAYMNRHAFEGMRTFLWFSCFIAIYAFGYALSLASTTIEEMQFWTAVQYLGMPFSAPATLILVLQYIGYDRHLNNKTYFFYYLIPAISFLLLATNDFHHLFYQSVYLEYRNTTPIMQITVGQWYLIHGAYTFGTLAIAFVLLSIYWVRGKSRHTKQVVILLTGILVPIVASFSYLIGITPSSLDPVPISMLFSSSLYLYAIISTKFLLVPPIEKDYIFESMGDAVLVLDQTYHIKDFNKAAFTLFSHVKLGEHIAAVLGLDSQLLPLMKNVHTESVIMEIEMSHGMGKEYYQVKISPIKRGESMIVGTTIIYTNITEQKAEQLNLTKLAYTDGLTQIYNRAYVLSTAEKMLPSYAKIAVILFDIDYFKKINDTYGHLGGDEALKHIAKLCKSVIQENGIFGRYGGEEFILFLFGIEAEEAIAIASSLRRLIEESPLHYLETVINITASFGVSIKEECIALTPLISEADEALYASKRGGRNTVSLAVEGKYITLSSEIAVGKY
ncbi:histidine kinase N-terminal 7TM domain-containing protein [Niallia sp.]|uniref:histidine kinase N-terminal 7TM domain-containing diguanylate cyclase n=1 Tax=Niallia sp. TaxID=2837523 RepID=UPI0028A10389|nr:histidine kinase N-terminal 7TM domain-containing protein [Niallia sp.]